MTQEKDLPKELLAELSARGDEYISKENAIEEIFKKAEKTLSINDVLIAFYKKTEIVVKRATMSAMLSKMAKNGLIHRVPNRLGFYMHKPQTPNKKHDK